MTVSLLQKSVRILPIIFILGIVGAGIYGFQGDAGKQESPIAQTSPAGGFSKALATGPLAAFLVHNERKTIAPFSFTDATGATRSLDQWKGRVVLLNLWATWCTPCRKEMSDLAQLQKAMGGDAFEVVALSIDRKGLIASQAFLKEIAAQSQGLCGTRR